MRRTPLAPLLLAAASLSCGQNQPDTPDSMKPGYYEIHADRKHVKARVDGAAVASDDPSKFETLTTPTLAQNSDAPTTRPVIRVELSARVEAGGAHFVPDRVVLANGQGRRVLLGTNFDGGTLLYEVGDLDHGLFPVRMWLSLQGSANVDTRFVANLAPNDTRDFITVARSGDQVRIRLHLDALDPMPAPDLKDMKLVTPLPGETRKPE